MEFAGFAEAWPDLARRGIVDRAQDDGTRTLDIDPAKSPTMIEIGVAASGAGAIEADVPTAAAALEALLHKLHVTPLYLVPFDTWRQVFDVVAFGLAKNAHWQEIDSQASVELNTRDPLVCELRDLHTLRELVRTLVSDGESSRSGLAVVATGQSIVVHVTPTRALRIAFASAQVARQARDAALHFLGRHHAD